MPSKRAVFTVAIIGLLSPWLIGRYRAGSAMYKNRPSSLQTTHAFSTHQILYEDKLRNCEDVVIDDEEGIALLSCDPGRDWWNTVMGTFKSPTIKQGDIYLYHYNKAATSADGLLHRLKRQDFPPNRPFHPVGLEYHAPSGKVFVVNHAIPLGIEVFKFERSPDRLVYEGTFLHPDLPAPNSIYAINDHELFVSNDHFFPAYKNRYASLVEGYLAIPGGSIKYVNTETEEVRQLARLPFPNGVAMLNSTHLAAASTTGAHVRVYEVVEPTNKTLALRQTFTVPFFPDNLSVDRNGKLLIAGHPFPPSLEVVAKTNHEYALDGPDAERKSVSERPRAPTWALEWDGNPEGKLKDLYVGYDYGTGCTAVRDTKKKVGIIAGLYEKGILVFRE